MLKLLLMLTLYVIVASRGFPMFRTFGISMQGP
jgi:hypothetical protein